MSQRRELGVLLGGRPNGEITAPACSADLRDTRCLIDPACTFDAVDDKSPAAIRARFDDLNRFLRLARGMDPISPRTVRSFLSAAWVHIRWAVGTRVGSWLDR